MSYAAKFHSKFYGPFRVAADSAPKTASGLSDRASYQIDPARPGDALLSVERDVAEGADILMVKPGLPYLDILARTVAASSAQPWAVYEVSGEYAAHRTAGRAGAGQRASAHREAWTAFVRAGASMIISYGARHARELAGRLSRSDELFERARLVSPGGVHSPVRAFKGVGGTPRFMTGGHGALHHRRRRPRPTSISAWPSGR